MKNYIRKLTDVQKKMFVMPLKDAGIPEFAFRKGNLNLIKLYHENFEASLAKKYQNGQIGLFFAIINKHKEIVDYSLFSLRII